MSTPTVVTHKLQVEVTLGSLSSTKKDTVDCPGSTATTCLTAPANDTGCGLFSTLEFWFTLIACIFIVCLCLVSLKYDHLPHCGQAEGKEDGQYAYHGIILVGVFR